MTNHVHLIVSAKIAVELAAIIRDLKKYTSRMIIAGIQENVQESRKECLPVQAGMIWIACPDLSGFKRAGARNVNNKVFQFWQQDDHPIELSTNEMVDQRLHYLHENPVRAGIVWEAGHYKYSSAIDYYEERKGLLPIELL